jgi:hypothetical protein
MKIFLVFLALLILMTAAMSYAADMNGYVSLQRRLKALAEECAAGASLFTDPESFADGTVSIDEDDAYAYAEFLISKANENTGPLTGVFGVSLSFDGPTVTACVSFSGEDMFRLPFVNIRYAERTAAYRWEAPAT